MPRRQRSTWGSNDSAGPGKRRIRYWADLHDGRGYRRRTETVRGTRREADEVLTLRRIEHSRDGPTPTVSQAHDLWWVPWADRRQAGGRMSDNARKQFDSTWKNHVEPAWGAVPLTDVRAADVQDWLLTKSGSTAKQCRTVMKRIYRIAEFNEVEMRVNPMRATYEMPDSKKTIRSTDCYKPDELRRMWEAMRGLPSEPAFLLSAFGSCRVGESLGVWAQECRFGVSECGVPVFVAPIKRQVDNRGDGYSETLKNRFSRRPVVVCGPMAMRLGGIAETRVRDGYTWLSGDETGSQIEQMRYRRAVSRAAQSVGLKDLPPMTLRASWETIARWTLRIGPSTIERMMGHSVGGVTGQHYDRPIVDDFVREASVHYKEHPFADSWDNLG
jgi:hypothetical protein